VKIKIAFLFILWIVQYTTAITAQENVPLLPFLEKHKNCITKFCCNEKANGNTIIGGMVGATVGCYIVTVGCMVAIPLSPVAAFFIVTGSGVSGMIIGRSGCCMDQCPTIATRCWCTPPEDTV
jgi:hypothetical protein